MTISIFTKRSQNHAETVRVLAELLDDVRKYPPPSTSQHLSKYNIVRELILAYFRVNSFTKCISLFTGDIEEKLGSDIEVKRCLSVAELNTNTDWFKAHKYLRDITAKSEDNVEDKFMLASVSYKYGHFGECEKLLASIANRSDEHEVYLIACRFWLNFEVLGQNLAEFQRYIANLNSDNEYIKFYKNFASFEFGSANSLNRTNIPAVAYAQNSK